MAATAFDPEARPDRARAIRAVRIVGAALFAILAVGAAAWLALGGDGVDGRPPLILAEKTPERARPDPDQPGGEVIPHQDQIVYEIVGREQARRTEEALAPAAEAPMPAPQPENPPPRDTTGSDGPVQLLPPAPKPDRIDPSSTPLPGDAAAGSPPPPPPAPPQTPDATPPARQPLPSAASIEAQPSAKPQPASAPQEAAKEAEKPLEAPPPSRQAPPKDSQPTQAAAAAATLASLPEKGTYRIQIGAVRDQETAQREWRRLKSKHADILGGMQPFLQEVDIAGKGAFLRIQAGPMPEKLLAEIACDQLKSRKVPCFVIAQ